jgi:methionyl-tRNA formyltransferase
VLDIPKFGTINLHASLLPKYRGANPIQAPIINGDKFTGITTMLTEIGIDTGSIVLQKVIEIIENMTSVELSEIISKLSPELIYESIVGLYNEKIKPVPQKDEEATHAPKVTKDDGIIDWSEPAIKIHNKVRGLKPWPSCFTYINGSCIKITETRLLSSHPVPDNNFGEIIGKTDNGINVITGDGLITITKVQPACKKEMDALSWYNGARIGKGTLFKSVCESEAECTYETSCEIPENTP